MIDWLTDWLIDWFLHLNPTGPPVGRQTRSWSDQKLEKSKANGDIFRVHKEEIINAYRAQNKRGIEQYLTSRRRTPVPFR